MALSVYTGDSVWCCEFKVDITAVVYWYRIDKTDYEPSHHPDQRHFEVQYSHAVDIWQ